MKLTVYNLLMSLLWSDVCVLLFCVLRRRYTFLRDYGFGPLFGLLAVALVRFFLPIELPFTAIIPSYNIMPSMQLILRKTGPLGFSWHGWLAVIWGAVSLMLLFRLLLGIWLQKKRIAAMPSGDSALANLAIQAIMPLGVHWRPTVVVSSSVSVPSVTGFFAPTFLLPELKLTQQQLQEVLRHELGHFLGRDAWIKLGISVFQLVFWWNPLVYLLGKDLNFLLEVRADAYAIGKRSEEEQLDYLEAVTEVIRQLGTNKKRLPNYTHALQGAGANDQLYMRMQLAFEKRPRRSRGRGLLAACLAALLLASYSFVVQPRSYPEEADWYFDLDTGSAYLLMTRKGNCELYINDMLVGCVSEDVLDTSPYNELEMKEER